MNRIWKLTFSLFDLSDFMLIVCMVGIPWIKEVELWVAQFILSDPSFKFRTITSHKAGSFIDNIYLAGLKKYFWTFWNKTLS